MWRTSILYYISQAGQGIPVNLSYERIKTTMPKKQFVPDLIDQAKSILSSWKQIDPKLAFGSLNIVALEAGLTRANGIDMEIKDLESKLTNLRNQREACFQELWDMLKRVRFSIKGMFGDDSVQYEMVGGKRLSERKSPRRNGTPVP
jgi:hypothetical protein